MSSLKDQDPHKGEKEDLVKGHPGCALQLRVRQPRSPGGALTPILRISSSSPAETIQMGIVGGEKRKSYTAKETRRPGREQRYYNTARVSARRTLEVCSIH